MNCDCETESALFCRYTCELCQKTYKYHSGLCAHRSSNNCSTGGQNFQCHTCHRRYKNKCTLIRHVRNECGKDPKFVCVRNDCTYRTHRRDHLKIHHFTKHNVMFE